MMPETIVVGIFFFLFGAIIGSFLNVCIVRMPQEKSIVFPGSHCVKCQSPIQWYDNIPILSYFVLGGKCRQCSASYSVRYPLIELLTAVTFLGFYLAYGLDLRLLAYLVMTCGFIVATFVDFEHRIIPDEISIGGVYAGLVLSFFIVNLHDVSFQMLNIGRVIMGIFVGICALIYLVEYFLKREKMDAADVKFFSFIGAALLFDLIVHLFIAPSAASWQKHLLSLDASVIGFLVGGGSIYLMGRLGDVMFKKESMGGGDIKLLAMIGAFLGWKLAILTFFVAPFFGAVFGIIEKIRTNDTTIPYGPFLVLGALISLFFGDQIISFILHGYGFGP